ncbi:peptidoglycan DD-metalloendopeptidase family protein [Streptomyces sp. NPDC102462]|uniref:peptidoglycan DD-metalloendopeptidase family protein n=1 Tax=Streptomyces sp. NPDC102462 TaxID=3366178 RepID=UPI003806143F
MRTTLTRRSRGFLLCTVLTLGLSSSPAPAAWADDEAGPLNGSGATSQLQVQSLYEEAARAAGRHEAYRRSAEVQATAVRLLRSELARQRSDLRELKSDVGELARIQYRGGLLPDTLLALTRSTRRDALRNLSLVRSAHHGLTSSLRRVQRNTVDLTEAEQKAMAGLRLLRTLQEQQAAAKRDIQAKLRRARALQEAQARRAVTPCRDGSTPVHRDLSSLPLPVRSRDQWTLPVQGYVLSAGFGAQGSHWAHRHTGQDFAVPVGTPVRAVGAGVVVAAGCDGPFGNNIVIRHDNGYHTQYAHLSVLRVSAGDSVGPGDPIALSGNSGNSSGPHLHFEVRVTQEFGSEVDPVVWMQEHGVTF